LRQFKINLKPNCSALAYGIISIGYVKQIFKTQPGSENSRGPVFRRFFILYSLRAGDGAALDCEAGIRFQSEKGAHFRFFDLNQPLTNQNIERKNSMNQYHKLYTPEDSAVVFIDHQPQMTFGVASIERASLIEKPLKSSVRTAISAQRDRGRQSRC